MRNVLNRVLYFSLRKKHFHFRFGMRNFSSKVFDDNIFFARFWWHLFLRMFHKILRKKNYKKLSCFSFRNFIFLRFLFLRIFWSIWKKLSSKLKENFVDKFCRNISNLRNSNFFDDYILNFIACNRTKMLHIHRNYPGLPSKHRKLFSLSCFERISDIYLIRYICKHCNTSHIFEVWIENQANFQGFEVVAVRFVASSRRLDVRVEDH